MIGVSPGLRVTAWLCAGFLVLPLLIVLPVSFTDQRFLSLPRHGISLQHYATLVFDEIWRGAIWRSLLVATTSTLIATCLGTLCAIACWRLGGRFAEWVRLLMLTPIITPGIVCALAFYRHWIDLGLLDTYTGVILANIVLAMPYVVIAVAAALANFDFRLEQAARSLGASMGQTVRLVIVPGVMPGIVAGAILAFTTAWDEITVLLFITGLDVRLLPRVIWDGINDDINPSVAAVAAVLITVTFVILLANALIKERGRVHAR